MEKGYDVKKLPGRNLWECPYCGRTYESFQSAVWCKIQCQELGIGVKTEDVE